MAETPLFAFRLGKPERLKLVEMARIYGSPTPSAFVREMVSAICSGETGAANGFLGRLGEKLTGQMTLELQQQAMQDAAKGPARRVKRRKRRGGRRGTP